MTDPTSDQASPPKTADEWARLLNPELPDEVGTFASEALEQSSPSDPTVDQWTDALHDRRLKDVTLQLWLRIGLSIGVFVLLTLQNIGVWFIVVWAMHRSQLTGLQLIFSTLIAGSLTQSFLVLRLIVIRAFNDIDYSKDGDGGRGGGIRGSISVE